MSGIRPIIKDVEQDTLEIARVFKILSDVEVGKMKAVDVYFTEQGVGYLNALASLNPRLFVVPEEKYLDMKEKYDEMCKTNLYNQETKEEYSEEIKKLKQTIDSLRKPKKWKFWK